MSDIEPRNGLAWRVGVLEREVQRLQDGKPDVVAERVERLFEEMKALREELSSQRKILIGFFASFAGVAVLIVVAYLVTGSPAA